MCMRTTWMGARRVRGTGEGRSERGAGIDIGTWHTLVYVDHTWTGTGMGMPAVGRVWRVILSDTNGLLQLLQQVCLAGHPHSCSLMLDTLLLAPMWAAFSVASRAPTDIRCHAGCSSPHPLPVLRTPAAPAWTPLPLGRLAPRGWLLEQLLLQANSLSGFWR